MAGVVLRSFGGASLAELGIVALSQQQANEIARAEAEAALDEIRDITPVDTGQLLRSWALRSATVSELVAEDTAPYAEWVHYAGEKGVLFWETYCLPLWQAAQDRVTALVLEAEEVARATSVAREAARRAIERVSPRAAPQAAVKAATRRAFAAAGRIRL